MNNIDILEEIKNKFNKTMKILALGEHSTFVDNSFFDDFGKLINISETLIAENKELKEKNKKLEKDVLISETLLTAYEKQSKEIEELKEDNKKKSIVIIEYQDLYEKLEDKIKAKIEKLDYNDIGNFERRCKQEVLQSLLEKE